MTQQDLDLQVASTLGEDVREIRRRGFSIADPLEVAFDPDPDDYPSAPQVVDWDSLEADRFGPQRFSRFARQAA
jgi:hypothetical protein